MRPILIALCATLAFLIAVPDAQAGQLLVEQPSQGVVNGLHVGPPAVLAENVIGVTGVVLTWNDAGEDCGVWPEFAASPIPSPLRLATAFRRWNSADGLGEIGLNDFSSSNRRIVYRVACEVAMLGCLREARRDRVHGRRESRQESSDDGLLFRGRFRLRANAGC